MWKCPQYISFQHYFSNFYQFLKIQHDLCEEVWDANKIFPTTYCYQISNINEKRGSTFKKAQNTHGYSPSDSAATTSWSRTAGARCSSPFDLNFKFNNIIRNPHHNLSISRPMFRDCLDMCKLSHRLKKDMAHSNKCLSRSILEYKVCGICTTLLATN